jgi:hypothetical protein
MMYGSRCRIGHIHTPEERHAIRMYHLAMSSFLSVVGLLFHILQYCVLPPVVFLIFGMLCDLGVIGILYNLNKNEDQWNSSDRDLLDDKEESKDLPDGVSPTVEL